MRRAILLFAILLAAVSEASATTYNYVGNPYTSFGGGCTAATCTNATGTVTFDFDTSQHTGTIQLSNGDTASLSSGIGTAVDVTFPASQIGLGPIEFYLASLFGNFTLVDGSIVSWALGGSIGLQNCGGGPGCAIGDGFIDSDLNGDSSGYTIMGDGIDGGLTELKASNVEPGIWTEQIDAVPELSTWAMLLIGFAGIGFASLRRFTATRLHQSQNWRLTCSM